MDSNGSACPVKREMLTIDYYHMMNVIVTERCGADREVLTGEHE